MRFDILYLDTNDETQRATVEGETEGQAIESLLAEGETLLSSKRIL